MEINKIYQGSTLEVLKQMPDDFVNLLPRDRLMSFILARIVKIFYLGNKTFKSRKKGGG